MDAIARLKMPADLTARGGRCGASCSSRAQRHCARRNGTPCTSSNVLFNGELMMNSDINKPADASKTRPTGPARRNCHNDRTHDSRSRHRRAKNLAKDRPHEPATKRDLARRDHDDQRNPASTACPERTTTCTASKRPGCGNHLLLALQTGCPVIDKVMVESTGPFESDEDLFDDPLSIRARRERGRIHYALNHLQPTRVIELHRAK